MRSVPSSNLLATRWIAQPSGFPAIDALLASPAFGPRDAAWEKLFVSSMREAFAYHTDHCPEFKAYGQRAGYTLASMRSFQDVLDTPWIFVQNFKEAEILSVRPDEVTRTFTSSGTGGAKTQLFLDATSLNRIEAAAYAVYEGAGVFPANVRPCNYLLFTYDIEHAPNLGTAWTDVTIADMLPGGERAFLLRWRDGEFRFDLDYALESLERFVASGMPIRMLGFPAFISHTLFAAEKAGVSAIIDRSTSQQSWILTGGGWKNHAGEPIPKSEFASLAEKITGIPSRNVRDMFGMSEHGVGYVDCEAGNLHVPAYAHAVTREPRTLRILPSGEPGILHLFSPILKSYPSMSLLTTDEAIVKSERCACGREGPTLHYVGRLGTQHHESCAIRALEYLSR